MPHRNDLHLARRLQAAVGSENMEDVLAAALTVSTASICNAFGESAVRHTTACQRFRKAFTEAVASFLEDLANDTAAADKSN